MNRPVIEPLARIDHDPGRTRQTALLALLALVTAVLFAYRETGLAMVTIWARSETFAHGFIVPLISLWLIWRQRAALARLPVRPAPWVALPAAALGFGWLLGDLAAVNAVTQLALTGLLVLMVVAVLGLPLARAMAFPLAFLFFAVPIGEFIMPQLMEWTADFTVIGLRASGIPVYREGLQFVIPSGNWSVVEACSGIRYLIASLMVGTLFAYLNYVSMKRRLIFIAFAILVPILANWMRAYLIVMLGHLSGNRLAVGVDHLIYGWLFFGLVIMIMFAVGARWRQDAPVPAAGPVDMIGTAAAAPRRIWIVAALMALVAALPHAALWALDRHDAAQAPKLALTGAGDWQPLPASFTDWSPVFENPPATANIALQKGPHTVGVHIAYYRNQTYQSKLVSSENMLVRSNDRAWAEVSHGLRRISFDGQAVTARTAQLRGLNAGAAAGEGRLAVWQWYWIDGRLTASDVRAKADIALSRLLGRGDDSASIILYAPENQPGGALAALEEFSRSGGAAVEVALRQAKAAR
ncbi:MAG: exosortase A [Betaproteobacteria bacterium]